MNRIRTAIMIAVAVTSLGVTAAPAHALAGDPVVTTVCDATVVVNTPVHCRVTIDQPGFTPNNQRITWRNPRTGSTSNVANYTVIPMTFDGTGWNYTYKPSLGEVGRTEVFSVTVPVSAAYNPRTVPGAAGFTVVGA